jgi:uncharacterized membrane protein YhiD involved in acid resistance
MDTTTAEAATWIERLVDKVGPAVAALLMIVLAGIYVFYRITQWIKPHAEKVVQAHLTFMDSMSTAMPNIEKKIEAVSVSSSEMRRKLDEMHGHVREIHGKVVVN